MSSIGWINYGWFWKNIFLTNITSFVCICQRKSDMWFSDASSRQTSLCTEKLPNWHEIRIPDAMILWTKHLLGLSNSLCDVPSSISFNEARPPGNTRRVAKITSRIPIKTLITTAHTSSISNKHWILKSTHVNITRTNCWKPKKIKIAVAVTENEEEMNVTID